MIQNISDGKYNHFYLIKNNTCVRFITLLAQWIPWWILVVCILGRPNGYSWQM